MAARYLNCTCCGGSAGRWEQFHNQDTGYGLCAKCAAWIAGKGQTDMERTYGVAGVHREAPSIVVYGRRYEVTAAFRVAPDGQMQPANAWMEKHPDQGLIAEQDGWAYIARLNDKGVPAHPATV